MLVCLAPDGRRPEGVSAAGSSRCSVRTTKSPASISSVNDSPGLTSVSRIRIGSPPGGVMVNTVPTANGPSTVIVSMPSFHCGQDAMSAQWPHSASGAALVSSRYSYSHIIPPCADDLSTDYTMAAGSGSLRHRDDAAQLG